MAGSDDSKGHRGRLRARFLSGGPAALHDYELLEMALFAAHSRGDTKPLAKRLMKHFGDYVGVITAEPARLKEVDGIGEAAIAALKLVELSAQRLAQGRIIGKHVLSSWDAVLEYCQISMAHQKTELFRVFYLDRRNRLIADEVQQQGTIDHTPVYPREVARRGIELQASAVIIVHNHPSGDPTPSAGDIAMTKEVRDAAKAVGITLHDHLVIGRGSHASFKSLGLL